MSSNLLRAKSDLKSSDNEQINKKTEIVSVKIADNRLAIFLKKIFIIKETIYLIDSKYDIIILTITFNKRRKLIC